MSKTARDATLLLACSFASLAIAFGVRTSFGFFLGPLSSDLGWSIASISLAIAVQNLVWGAAQPFAGGLSDARGVAWVVAAGALLYALGLGIMAFTTSETVFLLACGIIVGLAQAAVGFPVLLGAIGRTASDSRRSLYLGIATAGGSFGQFLFAPLGPWLLARLDRASALFVFAVISLAILPLAIGMRREARPTDPKAALPSLTDLRGAFATAMRHRGFLLLTAGFFVCGFQLAFVTFHLPVFAALCGLGAGVAATSLAMIGAFNIIGTIGAGQIGAVTRPKFPLALIYVGRGLGSLMMVLLPVTEFTLYAFAVLMGLLWLSTVPLTSGIVGQIFGPRHVGMLFGVVFFSHQLGSFIGLFLAGWLYDRTGSYHAIWWLSAALGFAAALVNLPIDDRRVAGPAVAAAR